MFTTLKTVDRDGKITSAAAIRSRNPEEDRKWTGRITFKDGHYIERGFCETREDAEKWLEANPDIYMSPNVPRIYE